MELNVVCSANIWRCLDASVATRTRRESARLAAAWPGRGAKRADGFRAPSTAPQASPGLERRQAAPARLAPLPARPPAHCILIQPALALGRCTAALHGPATARHVPHGVEGRPGGAKTPSARSSVGSLRRRLPHSHRRHAGGIGSARGRQHPSSQRGPCAPAPALRRCPPAASRAARPVVPWRCCPPSQTSSCPQTASTEAWC
jgi:hypothetical protein